MATIIYFIGWENKHRRQSVERIHNKEIQVLWTRLNPALKYIMQINFWVAQFAVPTQLTASVLPQKRIILD